MRYFVFFSSITCAALLPFFAEAQETKFSSPVVFVDNYTLLIGIFIGLVASILTVVYSLRMGRSMVGDILRPIGVGMFFIVLGFLAVAIAWAEPPAPEIVHNLLFTSGYIMMLIGVARARKLSS
ncbi:MAG TPA: hypothetical protein VI981_05115 [Candidatus Paceibacterota bacterium]